MMSHQKLKKGADRRGVERGRPHVASPGDTILREPSVEGQRVHRGARAGGGSVSPYTPTLDGRHAPRPEDYCSTTPLISSPATLRNRVLVSPLHACSVHYEPPCEENSSSSEVHVPLLPK